jgi:hypothetical protein
MQVDVAGRARGDSDACEADRPSRYLDKISYDRCHGVPPRKIPFFSLLTSIFK